MEEKKLSANHQRNPQQIKIELEKIEENQKTQKNQENNEENKKKSNKENPPQRIISEEDYIKFQKYQAWLKKLQPNQISVVAQYSSNSGLKDESILTKSMRFFANHQNVLESIAIEGNIPINKFEEKLKNIDPPWKKSFDEKQKPSDIPKI